MIFLYRTFHLRYNNSTIHVNVLCYDLVRETDMKIEKINDNQIRCTLNRQDLEDHQIRLSELAYGTDKAKELFRDMIQQARIQVGFEVENIPLMIEAIPLSTESIILIITKVEDPEELDTRFSKFAPFKGSQTPDVFQLDGADNILDLFQKIQEARKLLTEKKSGIKETGTGTEAQDKEDIDLIRLFAFKTLDDVIRASHSLPRDTTGQNTLYRDAKTGAYHLVLHQDGASPQDFNKICNLLQEYGEGSPFTPAGEAFLKEHGDLISVDALSLLRQV